MLRREKRIRETDLLWAQINDQVAPLFDYWLEVMRVPGSFSQERAPVPFADHEPVISGL
jgi:hypothetical protein